MAARPASEATSWIQAKANEFLSRQARRACKRVSLEKALAAPTTHRHDYLTAYVEDLGNIIDMEAIRASGIKSRGESPGWRRGALLGTDRANAMA